jgi:soluble lytic murein transglycosylase-like protein
LPSVNVKPAAASKASSVALVQKAKLTPAVASSSKAVSNPKPVVSSKPASSFVVEKSAESTMALRTTAVKPTGIAVSTKPLVNSRSVPVAPSASLLGAGLLPPLPMGKLQSNNSPHTINASSSAQAEAAALWPAKPKLAPLSIGKGLSNPIMPPKQAFSSLTQPVLQQAALPSLTPPVFAAAFVSPVPAQAINPVQPARPVAQPASFQAFVPPQRLPSQDVAIGQTFEPLRAVASSASPSLSTTVSNRVANEQAQPSKPLTFWERLTSRFRHHHKQSTASASRATNIASTALMAQPVSPVPPMASQAQGQQRLTGLAMAFGTSPALPSMATAYTPSMVFGAMKQPPVTEASRLELIRFIAKTNRNLEPYQQEGIANGILELSYQQGVDYRLLASLLAVESSFRTEAISSTGAIGLGQLKDFTAKWLQVSDPFDPVDNLTGVSKYLKYLVGLFPGQVEKAVASYYMGQGNVQRQGLNEAGWSYVRKVDLAYQNLLNS